MDGWINISAVWRIAVVSLTAGAGLPALFALGILGLASGGRSTARPALRAGVALAVVCFTLVFAAAVAGLIVIAS